MHSRFSLFSAGHGPDFELQRGEVAEDVGSGRAHARYRSRINSQRLCPPHIADRLDDCPVLMAIADQIVLAGQRHGLGVMGVMHDEDSPARELEGGILPVIEHLSGAFLRKAGQIKQIAGVISVNHVNGQAQPKNRMQRGWRDEVTAVQHNLRTEGLGLGNGGREGLAMIVTIGDNADLQVTPSFLSSSHTSLFYCNG